MTMLANPGAHEDETAPVSVALTAHLGAIRSALFRHTTDADPRAANNAVYELLSLAAVRRPGEAAVAVSAVQRSGPALLVVADDIPLLVDSLMAAAGGLGAEVARVLYPALRVERSSDGTLIAVSVGDAAGAVGDATQAVVESWIRLELALTTSPRTLDRLAVLVRVVLGDLQRVASDTPGLHAAREDVAQSLDEVAKAGHSAHHPADLTDCADLLRWLGAGHFTLLGYRYDGVIPIGCEQDARFYHARGGLGMPIGSIGLADAGHPNPPTLIDASASPVLVLTQGPEVPTVHQGLRPYIVAVPAFGNHGAVEGEHRFLGVFTVAALHENVLDIPVLARRARTVIDRAGYRIGSHSGQTMLEVIQDYPRTELFSTDVDSLFETVISVVGAPTEKQVLLFLRPDDRGQAISALVYMPRDRYSTRVRMAMQDVLVAELGGSMTDFTVRVTETALALVHFTIGTGERDRNQSSTDWVALRNRMQVRLSAVSRTWDDDLRDQQGQSDGTSASLAVQYAELLPESYKHDFGSSRAASDIARLEALSVDAVDVQLYERTVGEVRELRFTLYIGGHAVSLSDVLPILHSLGVGVLDERPYPVVRPDGLCTWIYDFGLSAQSNPIAVTGAPAGWSLDTDPSGGLAHRFCAAFVAVWQGRAEADSFNGLIAGAGLTWQEASLLRAYANYLRQIGFPYSPNLLANVLAQYPESARRFVNLFAAMFDPDNADESRAPRLEDELRCDIDAVLGLEPDRILRSYRDLILATVRTNYYVTSRDTAEAEDSLSFKLDPRQLVELPKPRPRIEIYVYSPRVEGVHLRFGSVARGGLRWSDRLEDYRTEVLGLVKAQAVKNAVIVPVGAKGGFVVKHPPAPTGDAGADRDAIRSEGLTCYRSFISALLDITDNVDQNTGAIITPARVVRRDGEDPYLVVAADKGTATFSDAANAVARSHHFWLGDAFASGGSIGYDHKGMGITAKGAWESVKRHFRELGVDTQRDEFAAVGIGDMSGDVFGNGMLLSRHIRLVAAFDHRHIFIDPAPDPQRSYSERARLFALKRSSWADYDPTLISTGGGAWERNCKTIPISAQVREVLGLPSDVSELAPPQLVRAILLAPVDLLWNGGVGTYIKAVSESQTDVGDKANDVVRVNGRDVRARVVAEGGNLGITERGRIEFALSGGKINTDALDNSGGVDCSDHEVNIKILLDELEFSGHIDKAARNSLFKSMTGEVERLVLCDNISQNELMGVSRTNAAARVSVHARQITALVAARGLDRELEVLPSEEEISRRRQHRQGLTSPELATLMAHIKLALKSDLLHSDLPDSAAFADHLYGYFPAPLQKSYPDAIAAHRLRREIVATVVTNEVVDQGGLTYVYRLGEDVGASSIDAVRAFTAASKIFALPILVNEVRNADISATVSDNLILEIRRLLDRVSRWLLASRPQPIAVEAEITRFASEVQHLLPRVPQWLAGPDAQIAEGRAQDVSSLGAPKELAAKVFTLLHAYCALDIIDVADLAGRDTEEVAELYYTLNGHLGIDYLLTAISSLDASDRWHALARLALRDDIYTSMRALCLDVLTGSSPQQSPSAKIADWELTNASRLSRARATLAEIFTGTTFDLATLTVAARQVRTMVSRSRTDIQPGHTA